MAKILIVDDDVDIGIIISERLRNAGHEVLALSDSMKAMKKVEETNYDLAILDIHMPGRDGYAVCYLIKTSPNCKNTRVLLISAVAEEQSRWRKSKADGFLGKPFEAAQLLAAVERLLLPGQAAS